MSNEDQTSAYDVVLADLIARRDQLNAAIAAIEAAKSGNTGSIIGAPSLPLPAGGGSPQIRQDEFFNMTVLDAAKKYLGMMKRPQTARSVTDALVQGGYLFSSANPITTVAAILNRATNGGGVARVGKGTFGLSEWYPGRPRNP